MFHGTGLGHGGGGHGGGHGGGGGHHGGGGHGGGGHGGGGHHGSGGHHGGGGGRRRSGRTVVVESSGYGPGWYNGDASYPYPMVVQPDCAVVDPDGNCICQLIDNNGRCMAGLGDDAPAPAPVLEAAAMDTSGTTWIAGGLLVLLAFGALALEKKGPAPFRRAA